MSNLLKSKLFVGVMIVAVMVVAFAAFSGTASAATCSITTTLRVGSTGTEVQCLQTLVGVNADGKFGPMTKAAVQAWQTSKGLVADGVFGAKSRAVYSGTVTTTGCPAGALFNPMTGASCTGTSTVPGCVAGALFSSTTGASCTGGTTVTPSGTNGYLTDFASDSTNRVSTVYEAETDKVVAGIRGTAKLADQTIDRVRVTFDNANGASSANLAKYVSSVSLWLGSTKIATMPVSQADRNTSTDVFTFNFTGLHAVVPKDQIGRLYVSVDANGSIDTNDVTASWTIDFIAYGIDAVSPDGTSDTYPSTAVEITGLGFGKFVSNGVKATVGLASTNPTGGTISVSATANTNSVTLLKFTVKATNSDLTLRKVPITMTSTTAHVHDIINTLKLYQGSNLVDSVDGSTMYDFDTDGDNTTVVNPSDTTLADAKTGVYLFSNLSDPYNKITSGSTVEYSVVADLKSANTTNYSSGDSLTASLRNVDVIAVAGLSVNDSNGDQLTAGSTYRVGSAVGTLQSLLVNGVQVTMGAATVTTVTDSGDITQVNWSIPVTATAFGDTLYIGQAVQLADTATGNGASANAFSLSFEDSSAPATHVNTCTSCVYTLASSDAQIEGNGYRLDSGSTKHFTITVNMITPTTAARSYRVVLNQIRTDIESTLENVVSALVNQDLTPEQNYQTSYQYITS